MIFSSCTNFFDGSNLKNQLDEVIEISQERPVTISIVKYNPNAFISLSPEGSMQYKRDQEFKIEANLKSDYSFIEWRIVDKRNGLLAENADDYIRLINPTHTETANGSISTVNVKIIKKTDEDFLQIVPVCSIKTDTKAPVFSGSFVCANSLENLNENKSIENDSRINGSHIFIKTDAEDEDRPDGFYIKETLISTDNNLVPDSDNVKESLITGVFTETKMNVYSCNVEYELKTVTNGFIQMDIQLIDAAGNKNPDIKTYRFFNDTVVDVSSMFIYSRHGWDNEKQGFTMEKESEAVKTIFWSPAIDTKKCNDILYKDEIENYTVSWGYSEDEIAGSVSSKNGVIYSEDSFAFLQDGTSEMIEKEYFYRLPDSVFEENKDIYVTVTAHDCAGNTGSCSNVIFAKPEILNITKFHEGETTKYRYNITNIFSDRFEDTKGYDILGYKVFAEDPETGRVLILSDEEQYRNMSYNSQFSAVHTMYVLDGNWYYTPDLTELEKTEYKIYIQPVYIRQRGQTPVDEKYNKTNIFNEFLSISTNVTWNTNRHSVVYGQLGEFDAAGIEDLDNLTASINTDCIEAVQYLKGELNSWRINVQMTLKENAPVCKNWLCKVSAGSQNVTVNNIQCTDNKTLSFEIGDNTDFFNYPGIFTLTGFDENGKVVTHTLFENPVGNKYQLDTVFPYATIKYSGEENCVQLIFQDVLPSAFENSECSIEYCIFPYNIVSSYEQVTSKLLEEYEAKTVIEKLSGDWQEFIYNLPMNNFEKYTSYSIYAKMTDAAGNYKEDMYNFAITNPPDWSQVPLVETYKNYYEGFELGRYIYTYQADGFTYLTPAGIEVHPAGENSLSKCNIAMLFESSKGLKIEYDQSCIVQTYYSRRNLGSDISDWVLFGTEYNTIEYVPEKSGEYSSSYYYTKKPEDLTINWGETYYYITVCFFSDLTRCTSSVREWHAFE